MKRAALLCCLVVLLPVPVFSQGWLGSLSINPGDQLSFSAGYIDHRNGVVVGFGSQDDSLNNAAGGHQLHDSGLSLPLRGVRLRLSGQKTVSPNTAFVLAASYLIPFSVDVVETSDWRTNRQGYHQRSREWSSDIQWWDVEGMGVYRSYESVSVLGGFRYGSFQISFTDPDVMLVVLGLNRGFPTDESNLTVNCYIPYAGIQIDMGSTQRLTVRAIGTPWLPGDVTYGNTANAERQRNQGTWFNRFSMSGPFRSAYFLELFAEYGLDVSGFNAALFGQYSLTHAEASLDKEREIQPAGGAAFTDSERFSFSFNRSVWTVGGKISVQFGGLL